MIKTIITISGVAESGKDTFGNILSFHFKTEKLNVLRINYADWLKKIAEKLIGYNEKDKPKYRTELQRIGTDVIRKTNEDYWVDTAIGAFEILGSEADVMIIADARFENEILLEKWKEKFNVINILIKRNKENSLSDEQRSHTSETNFTGIPETYYDYIIENDNAINDLYYNGEKIAKELIKKYLV